MRVNNWNNILSNTRNLNDVLVVVKKILAMMGDLSTLDASEILENINSIIDSSINSFDEKQVIIINEFKKLMEELAATNAGENGWLAEFIADGKENQKQINDKTIQYVDSIDALRLLKPRHYYAIAETTAYYADSFNGKNRFKWDQLNVSDDNGYSIIKVASVTVGRWRMLDDESITINQLGVRESSNDNQNIINLLNTSGKRLKFSGRLNIDNQLSLNKNNSEYAGQSTKTEINYLGVGGSTSEKLAILKAYNSGGEAVSNIKISDLTVLMNLAENSIGFKARYLTNESLIERLVVRAMASSSIGIFISKCWYAKFRQCMVSGYSAALAGRHGIGVYIESLRNDAAQVNAIEFDIKCHTLDVGYFIDPQNYVYGLNIANMPTIENCGVGIKVKSSTSDLSVRQSMISAYFEHNDKDIEWGDESNQRFVASQHKWIGCSFDSVYSTIEIWEGSHVFDSCKGIVNLKIGANASVKFINTPAPTGVVTNYGSSNYFVEPNAKSFITSGTYKLATVAPGATYKQRQTTSATSAIFDISKPFSTASFEEGQTAEIRVTSRRSYDNTLIEWRGTLLRKATGSYLVEAIKVGSIVVSISGDNLTVNDSRGDAKVYELVMHID